VKNQRKLFYLFINLIFINLFYIILFRPLSDNFLPRVEKFELLPVVAVLQQPNNHSRSFLNNCVEHLSQNSRNNSYSWPSVKREDSPGLIELEAEIEALRFVTLLPGNTEQGKCRLTNEYLFFLFFIGCWYYKKNILSL